MTIFNASIVASADDAAENNNTVTIDGSVVNCNGSDQYILLRFLNVTIPGGSTINAATLNLYFTSSSWDDPDVTIHCEDVANSAAATTATSNLSSRPRTTAGTVWNVTGLGVGYETTPDFAPSVQEVTDRPDWQSGNALSAIIKGNDSASLMRIRAVDDGSGNVATISIDYTAPVASGGPVKFMYYAQVIAG